MHSRYHLQILMVKIMMPQCASWEGFAPQTLFTHFTSPWRDCETKTYDAHMGFHPEASFTNSISCSILCCALRMQSTRDLHPEVYRTSPISWSMFCCRPVQAPSGNTILGRASAPPKSTADPHWGARSEIPSTFKASICLRVSVCEYLSAR